MSISLFTEWMHREEIYLHDHVELRSGHNGISVYHRENNDSIISSEKVAIIPKHCVLSVRTVALAHRIAWAPFGHDATLALSLALYSELLIGAHSRWHGYLQLLPSEVVPIARLWGNSEAFPQDEDACEAAEWIQGTEVTREMQDEGGNPLIGGIELYYASEACPLLDTLHVRHTLHGFMHAYSLVCSRAFLVDAYHGLSMVPVADAFNHSPDNHVQLASEYDVCPACGSLAECSHDREDSLTAPSAEITLSTPSIDSADTVDMVIVRSIQPQTEVFNTYGSDLGNAAFLARYGFSIEGGENNTITFGWPGSGLAAGGDDDHDWRNVFHVVITVIETLGEDIALIYVPTTAATGRPELSINSDGQVSAGLFAYSISRALFQLCSALERAAKMPTIVARTLSALLRFEDDLGPEFTIGEDQEPFDKLPYYVLSHVASFVCELCESRTKRAGKEGHRGIGLEEVGKLFDETPPERTKARFAISYLLEERAILEACSAQWQDLRQSLAGVSATEMSCISAANQ